MYAEPFYQELQSAGEKYVNHTDKEGNYTEIKELQYIENSCKVKDSTLGIWFTTGFPY